MASQEEEIVLTLNTDKALQSAKKFGPELEKAISVKQSLPGLDKLQVGLKAAAKQAGIITDKTEKLTKNFSSTSLDNFDDKMKNAVSYATELLDVTSKINELEGKETGPGKVSLKSLQGKMGAASKGGVPTEIDATRKAYAEAKEEYKQLKDRQAELVIKLHEEQSVVKEVADKIEPLNQMEQQRSKIVKDINTSYEKITKDAQQTEQATNATVTKTRKQTEELKEATQASEKLAKAQTEAAQNTPTPRPRKNPQAAPATSTPSVSPQQVKTINDLILKIYSLRSAGKDASTEFTELQNRLRSFDTATADASKLDDYLTDIRNAFGLIRKDLGKPDSLSDVFNLLTEAAEPAKQAFRDIQTEAKKTGNDVVQSANEMAQQQTQIIAAYMMSAQAEQERAAKQAEIDAVLKAQDERRYRERTAWVTAMCALGEQYAAEQAEIERQELQSKTAYITAMVALGAQAEREEQERLQAETQAQQNYLTSLLAVYTQQQQAEEEAISYARETASRMENAMRVGVGDGGIAELTRRLNDLKQAKEGLDKLGIPPETTQTYNQLVSQISQVEAEIKKYKDDMNEASSANDRLAKSARSAGGSARSGLKELPDIADAAKKSLKGISSLIGTIKKGFGGLSGTLNKVKGSFDGMAHNMKSNFKHMLTNVTKYVFGFRSLFFLVRRLRKYIGEGIQGMAQFGGGNNTVNRNISQLITSLEYLKNAWATAFDPILQVVTPMLTNLIDRLAATGNAFSRFLGNLLGVGKIFQAVKGPTKNYAKSLDKTGKSAGGAAKKQKKLNDRLADFDDLHVLGKDEPTSSSGGGGGSGGDDDDKKRNNKLWDFAKLGKNLQKAFKDMWATANFTKLGETIRDRLYKMLAGIKFEDKLKPLAAKLGKSFATFFNGLLGDTKLWNISGETIAKVVNTIGTGISAFLKNIKVDFGGGFASLINSFFKTIDWNQVNENIGLFGEHLVKNINSFFNNLNLDEISMDVAGLADSLTSVLVSLIDDVDWTQVGNAFLAFGNAISTGIENALKNSDNPLLQSLGGFITSVREASNNLLPVIAQIAVSIGQAFQAILPAISAVLPQIVSLIQQSATTVLPVLVSAIQTIVPVLTQIISTILPVLSQVLTALSPIFTMLAETILPMIANSISELLPVITPIITQLVSALVPVITDLVTNLLPVLQGIFTATLPILQQILPIVVQIVQQVLPILSQILVQLLPIIQQITEATLPVVVKLLDIIAPLIADILTAVSDLIGPVLGQVEPILTSITDIIGPLLDLLRPIVSIIRIVLNLVISILQPIMELIAPLMTMINDLLSPIFNILGLIGNIIQALVVPLLKVFASVVQAIVVPILKILVTIISTVISAMGNFQTVTNAVIAFFKTGFTELGNFLKRWVNGFIGVIEAGINGLISGINGAIKWINKISVDIPSWIPGVGGKKFGFNIKELHTISIPKLAQGAVIPPNNEFMAVLGDQSHGTNIEAPLDTIKQAVAEVMANNGNAEVIQLLQQLIGVVESKNLVIGDKEIGKANARYTNQQKIIRGTSF